MCLGIEGVSFMLDNAKKTPLRQFALAPSCVPSVPGAENSGAVFGEEEIALPSGTAGGAGNRGNHELCGCMQGG